MKKILKKPRKAIALLLIFCFAFSGCTQTDDKQESQTLTWYLPGTTMPLQEEVMEQFNNKLSEKYGLKLEIAFIDYGNFETKMQVINAGREKYDLAFTSGWLNDYYKNVSMGSFYDITELLDSAAPKLKDSMPDYVWNAIKVDGKIYAAINWQVQASATGLRVARETLDKYGFNAEQLKTYEDLEPLIKAYVAENSKPANVPGSWKELMLSYGLEDVLSSMSPVATYTWKEGKPVVINQYETPEYLSYIKLRERWKNEGLTQSNLLTATDVYKLEQTQGLLFNNNGGYKPGGDIESSQALGYEQVQLQLSNPVLATGTLMSTMTAVSATSSDPEQAVKFLEIINTDPELYNLLSFGIEGENYEKLSDKKIRILDSKSYTIANWMLGSVANSYILEAMPDTIWEDTKKYNDQATPSQLLGFNANTSPIETELANCANVLSEYMDVFNQGLVSVDEKYPEFISKLKAAGSDKIIAEIQSQIDTWYSNK